MRPLRGVLAAATLGLLAAAAHARSSSGDEPIGERGEDRRDVLVLVLDDVGIADIEAVPTPNIDALAGRGLTFTRAYSMPLCWSTRQALMFGEIPRGANPWVQCRKRPGPPFDQPSLPRALSDAGYATGMFGKWHAATNEVDTLRGPLFHGFDTWRAGIPLVVRACGGDAYDNWLRVDDGEARMETTFTLKAIRDETLAWLAAPREKPAFAYVGFQVAHYPYVIPPADLLPDGYPVPDGEPTHRQAFESMIAAADVAIGELVAAAPDAWIFVLGDNGTPRGVAPDPTKAKGTVGERGVNVPFFVAGPGIAKGTSDALIHVADLFATLVEGLGIEGVDSGRDGVSFHRLLVTPSEPGARASVFTRLDSFKETGPQEAIVEPRWKYWREDDGSEVLYDLAADPLETRPIPAAQAEPAVLERLRGRLREARLP